MTTELRRRATHCPPRPTIQQALIAIGMSHERVYCAPSWRVQRQPRLELSRRGTGFWERFEDLHVLGAEAREAYRAKVHRVRPDLTVNHVEATALNRAWAYVQRMFARRGVEI